MNECRLCEPMVMFFNELAKRSRRQNREMNRKRESFSTLADLLLSWAKFPVPDLGVDRPKCRTFCSVSVLFGHSNFCRLCPFDFGAKHPDLFDLNAGIVQVAADGILGRGFF